MNRVRELLKIDSLHRAGITGAGVGVAVLDSGIFAHADLRGRIAASYDVSDKKQNGSDSDFRGDSHVNGCGMGKDDNIYSKHGFGRAEDDNIYSGHGCGMGKDDNIYSKHDFGRAEDDNGHGTHVAGIIAGDGFLSHGKWRGIAPGARIIAVKVLRKDGLGKAADLMAGMEWVLKNREKYGIRIANISIGARPEGAPEEARLIRGVEALWDAGIVVTAAAGNNGPGAGTVTVPGSSRRIITVGASDDATPVWMGGRRREGYSGCGPVPDTCVIKPEVVAPGGRIMSLAHRYQGYTAKSGTSMAAPIVAGVIALLLGQRPELTPKEVKKLLFETSADLGLPKEKQGWGMVCPEKLLNGKFFR
ncbi:MAG: S8 family peptidase [Lachnospiraceae bacterium]|nr:S8 family peptidase [Lachnospiraceae bacterium]